MSESARPYFSIVVPTRNRSSLLEFALRSVLAQTETDFELIVSDNWSNDDTPDLVRRLGQEREIKLVRPPQPLPMADHWNFALSHATGDWILLLGDDDYFSQDLLSTVRPVTEATGTNVITWHVAFYHHNVDIPASEMVYVPFGFDPERINKLDLYAWTGTTYEIDARRQLERLYAFESIVAPTGHVSALRRDLIDEVVGWAGSLFHPPFPDFGCASAVLATAKSMTFIDTPLHVLGRVPRLGKYSYLLSPEKQEQYCEAFAQEYGRDDLFEGQPIGSPLLITCHVTASQEVVRRLMEATGRHVEFDWERYFLRCEGEITAMADAGIDTSGLVALYEEALAKQPPAVQKAVRSRPSARFPMLAHQVRRLKATEAAHRVRRLLYQRLSGPDTGAFPDRADLRRWRMTIDGAEAGFADIAQASEHVDTLRTGRAPLAAARRR